MIRGMGDTGAVITARFTDAGGGSTRVEVAAHGGPADGGQVVVTLGPEAWREFAAVVADHDARQRLASRAAVLRAGLSVAAIITTVLVILVTSRTLVLLCACLVLVLATYAATALLRPLFRRRTGG